MELSVLSTEIKYRKVENKEYLEKSPHLRRPHLFKSMRILLASLKVLK